VKTRSTVLLLSGVAAVVGCYDFDGAYNGYCALYGCGPDAGVRRFFDSGTGSDAGGGPGDGGSNVPDAGPVDAGPFVCHSWGQSCAAAWECCNSMAPPDGGADSGIVGSGDAGPQLGCSPLDYCEFRPYGCLPAGYYCYQDSDCCNGACNAGKCFDCAGQTSNAPCVQSLDCCIFENAECSAAGTCTSYQTNGNDGAHCLSDDFCTSNYCVPGAGGLDGLCEPAPTNCTEASSRPWYGKGPCCAGLSLSCVAAGGGCNVQGFLLDDVCCSGSCDAGLCDATGPGDGGWCCLPNFTTCRDGFDCCSGYCIEGVCNNQVYYPDAGIPCVFSGDCNLGQPLGQFTCDIITSTCEEQFCFPQQANPGWGGCGYLVEPQGYSVAFPDGGTCRLGNITCATSSQCCSGQCVTQPVNPPVAACEPITYY
jgi:hypothetical protein